MKRFSHGSELCAQARAARGRQPKGMLCLYGIEFQQARYRDRCAKGPHGCGRMKTDQMVMTPQPGADPDRGFHPDQRAGQQPDAISIDLLCHGQGSWKNHGAGMAEIGKMGVIIIKRMTHRPIGHRRGPRRDFVLCPKDHGLIRAPFGQDEFPHDPANGFVHTGKRHSQPVKE